ncbi:MAG TPA: DMT family transporter [Verrucomicrobiae bacterium]|nr:DMT family transporter [Verrucomicrobiae bacterium]
MKPLHLILLLLMNCLWAASYSAFKVLSPALDAGNIATLRFGLAGAVLLLCWPWLGGSAPRGRDLIRIIVMGILAFGLSPRLQVAGVQMGKAADASVLMAFDPLILSVAAAMFLREHIGPRRWLGFVFGLVGVVVMAEVWRPNFHWPALASNVLIVLSFFCDSSSSIIGKPILERAGALKVLAVAIVAGTVINLFVDGASTVRVAGALSFQAWLILAYLSLICTLLGYLLWFVVIREAQVNVAALTAFVQPIVGVGIAMAWLGETLRMGQFWGSLCIVAGLVIGLSGQIQASSEKRALSPVCASSEAPVD